jgi:hypothetical protein
MYNNYLGEGKLGYGMNCILAIACWSGYNQEDGIVMNYDALLRGMFRSMAFRSYEAYEEDDEKAGTKVRFGNPALIGNWKDLKPGLDYSKLDDRGIVKEGEYVDENTVIVGAYMMSTTGGQITDASTMPQVWTRGRVEKVVVMVNNLGLRLVKIRVVQDRIPELGDKFCLTDDHEVLTTDGWVNIKDITKEHQVLQRNTVTGKGEWVHPTDTISYEEGNTRLWNFQSEHRTLVVTSEHRLWTDKGFQKACDTTQDPIQMGDHEGNNELFTLQGVTEKVCKVYCISVPSEVFLVRYKDKLPLWTGNSNRHGQKGTIGALLRGHDMPRTQSGIVPDMIMNPHAIPSRMTIAQNLEQLLGKTAALSGAIGDGTAFMNDGSPQEEIGGILEQLGYEKYGNEVMYNGATGEQIEAAIFIGPVYGMRLKHMVEDKWQARGKGRKEVRTHQPTGGRGAQGGLKIGEMDRDAIIAHGGMAFVKESFMERSDGAKIPICVSCGTVPIYNPRLNLAMCQLCDGPLQFTGDNVNNLEVLPPLGRPKSRIVEVEMPYSVKLLSQEQEAYLNMTMRFITTSGVTRLAPLEYSGKSSEVVKELPRLILPDVVAPAYIEKKAANELTADQLRSLGVSLQQMTDEEKHAADAVLDDSVQGELLQQDAQLSAMADLQGAASAAAAATLAAAQPDAGFVEGMPLPPLQPLQPLLPQSPLPPMVGGLPANSMPALLGGDGAMFPASIPGGGRTIVVRTDTEAMAREGLIPMGPMGRQARRSPFRYGGAPGGMEMGMMSPMDSMGGMMAPANPRYMPQGPGGMGGMGSMPSTTQFRVNKME